MIARRVIKFLLIAILVGAACYLFHYNRDPVRVTLGPTSTIDAPLAVVLITVFFLGSVIVGLIAVVLGAKHSLADWQRERRQRRSVSHLELLRRAREQLAVRATGEARANLQKVVNGDSSNVMAWMLLADAAELEGNHRGTLDVLEQARLWHRDNTELLARTAQLNQQFGNTTAAYDNYALILQRDPNNAFVLRQLAACARSLGRFEESAKYVQELLRRSSGEEHQRLLSELAELELAHLRATTAHDSDEYRTGVEGVLRKHRDFPAALNELALLERNASHLDKATKHWTKAYEVSGNSEYLSELVAMWLAVQEPDKAIGAVRHAALQMPQGEPRQRATLYLIALLLYLEMLEEARSEVQKLRTERLSSDLERDLDILHAKLFARQGKLEEVGPMLLGLVEEEAIISDELRLPFEESAEQDRRAYWQEQFRLKSTADRAPSPRLSTP